MTDIRKTRKFKNRKKWVAAGAAVVALGIGTTTVTSKTALAATDESETANKSSLNENNQKVESKQQASLDVTNTDSEQGKLLNKQSESKSQTTLNVDKTKLDPKTTLSNVTDSKVSTTTQSNGLFSQNQKYNDWTISNDAATYTAGIGIYIEPEQKNASDAIYKDVSITKGTQVDQQIADKVNQDTKQNLAEAGLEPVKDDKGNIKPYTYKFNNMTQASIVNVRYYDKNNSATNDKSLDYNTPVVQANTYNPDSKNWETITDKETGKSTLGLKDAQITDVIKDSTKFTFSLKDINIDNKYKTGNYVFDLDGFTKEFDAAHASVLNVSDDGQSLTVDFNKVKDSTLLSNKKTSYEVFIKPKDQRSVSLKNINNHSRDSIINWFNASAGPGNGQYVGTTVLPDYSMGLGKRVEAYKNNPNYSAEPIQVKDTNYKLNISDSSWKYENNNSMDFLTSLDNNTATYEVGQGNLGDPISLHRGWLNVDDNNGMNHEATIKDLPTVEESNGYTSLDNIPYFVQYLSSNGNYIYSFEGTLGKAYNLITSYPSFNKVQEQYRVDKNYTPVNIQGNLLPIPAQKADNLSNIPSNEGYVINTEQSTLPQTYKFDLDNTSYRNMSTYQNGTYKSNLPQISLRNSNIREVTVDKKTVSEIITINGQRQRDTPTITFERLKSLDNTGKYSKNPNYWDPNNLGDIERNVYSGWKKSLDNNDAPISQYTGYPEYESYKVSLPDNYKNLIVKIDGKEIRNPKINKGQLVLDGISAFSNENGQPVDRKIEISYDIDTTELDNAKKAYQTAKDVANSVLSSAEYEQYEKDPDVAASRTKMNGAFYDGDNAEKNNDVTGLTSATKSLKDATEELQKALNDAKAASALDKAKKAYEGAKNNAQTVLNNAKPYADDKDVKTATDALQKLVDDEEPADQAGYEKATEAFTPAINKVNGAVNAAKDKASALEKAKTAYEDAKDNARTALTNAEPYAEKNEDVKTARKALQKLVDDEEPADQAGYEKATEAFTPAINKVNGAVNAAKDKASALDKAKTAYEDAKNNAQTVLNDAKPYAEKNEDVKTATDALQKLVDDEAPADQAGYEAATKAFTPAINQVNDAVKAAKEKASALEKAKKAYEGAKNNAQTVLNDAKPYSDDKDVKTATDALQKLVDAKAPVDQAGYESATEAIVTATDTLNKLLNNYAIPTPVPTPDDQLDTSVEPDQPTKPADQDNNSKPVVSFENTGIQRMITHNAYVYNKNGERVGVVKHLVGTKLWTSKDITIFNQDGQDKEFYQIGDNQYVKVANFIAARKTLTRNSYVYEIDGLTRANKETLKSGKTIYVYEIKTINGVKYYRVWDGYIKAHNFEVVKVTKHTLKHNSFVYNSKGKRISLKLLKKNHVLKVYGTKTIKGKKYFKIGKNQYVKVANFKKL